MRFLLTLVLCMHLLLPIAVHAQAAMKTPLSYSLSQYGVVLSTAILGGLAGWWIKVRRGELPMWSLSNLIGEMVISAFAGLLTFWLCEWWNASELLSAPLCGMAGLAGAKGLAWAENLGQRYVEKKLGLDADKAAP